MFVVPFTKLYKIARLAGASGILLPPYQITQWYIPEEVIFVVIAVRMLNFTSSLLQYGGFLCSCLSVHSLDKVHKINMQCWQSCLFMCVCVFSTTSLHIVVKHDIGLVHLLLFCFGLCRCNTTLNLHETQLALCILLLGAYTVMWSTYWLWHACPCVHTYQHSSHWMESHDNCYWGLHENLTKSKFCENGQNIRHFTQRPKYILLLLATLNYRKCSVFEWIGIRLLS